MAESETESTKSEACVASNKAPESGNGDTVCGMASVPEVGASDALPVLVVRNVGKTSLACDNIGVTCASEVGVALPLKDTSDSYYDHAVECVCPEGC